MLPFPNGKASPATTVDIPVEATTAISAAFAIGITAKNAVCAAMNVMKLSAQVV
jgi:hypothetical protein